MADLSKIAEEKVGYRLKADDLGGPYYLEILTFGNFIYPYSFKVNTPQEVYENLSRVLVREIEIQDSVTDRKRPVKIDVLVTATLEREAIMNSMSLIERYYLQDKK